MKTTGSTSHKRYWIVILCIAGAALLLNLAACSTAFCDFYTDHVYPFIADTVGWLTSPFPVALGELLMILGALLVLLAALIALLLIFLHGKRGYRRFAGHYFRSLLCTLAVVVLIYTLNWAIPFRGSVLGAGDRTARTYSTQELCILRNYVVKQLNEAAAQVERDADGKLIYPEQADVFRAVTDSMRALGEEYPRLKGYYPPMKPALLSDVLNWMYIGGYTYPYTMEITYNKYTTKLYYPSLLAHESSHHQGYYKENEANLFGYLGCVNSGDPFLCYSAYVDIYYDLDGAYWNSLYSMLPEDAADAEYAAQPMPVNQVWADVIDAAIESEEEYAQDSHPMENLSGIAEDVANEGWEIQGEILQENSYDGVVQLLLEYYDGILY